MNPHQLDRFTGEICGIGTTSGYRAVIGRWDSSPFGAFADVMLAQPDGRRILLAPTTVIGAYVSETYVFDEVCVLEVSATRTRGKLAVRSSGLVLDITVGRRTPLGGLLRMLPRRVAQSPRWAELIDPIARRVLQGVRTTGSAGNGRREWYGATDLHRVAAVSGSLDGADLGTLADVFPPVGFGFASTPRTPSICAVTTTVEIPVPAGAPA